jgi:hypothetical protein
MKYFIDTEFIEGTQTKKILGIPYGKTPPTIDLISIGIVSEDGREYYAISKDFNLREAWERYQIEQKWYSIDSENQSTRNVKVYWIRENVLKPIWVELSLKSCEGKGAIVNGTYINAEQNRLFTEQCIKESNQFTYNNLKMLINKYGKTNAEIATEVKEFCKPNRVYEVVQPITIKYSEIQNPEFYAYYADYDWVVFCWLFGKMNDLPDGFPKYCIDLKQELDRKAVLYFTDKTLEQNISYIKNRNDYPKETNAHNALADARWNQELYNFIKSL